MNLSSLHRLRVFLAAVDTGSVSGAARALEISQSTASNHLRHLEGEVGSVLIERASRTFRLTSAGDVLLDHARGIVSAADGAAAALERLSPLPLTGRLRVGATTTVAEGMLPPILRAFTGAHPDVVLDLHIANTSAALREVREGRTSIGIVAGHVAPDDLLEIHALAPEEEVIIVAGGHLLANQRADPTALRGTVALMREEGSSTRTTQESLVRGWAVPDMRTWTVSSTSAIIALVAAGLGIACLPRSAVAEQLASGRLAVIELEPRPEPRPVTALHRRDHSLSQAEEHFLGLITERNS